MKLMLPLLIVLFSTTALPAQDDATKEEIKKLQGNWVRTSFHADGKSTDDGDRPPDKQVKLEFQGSTMHGDAFTLDITKTPRHINVTTIGHQGRKAIYPGIYELKGDVLKLCFPFPFEGKFDQIHKRPTEFDTKAGDNHVTEVYRRVKK